MIFSDGIFLIDLFLISTEFLLKCVSKGITDDENINLGFIHGCVNNDINKKYIFDNSLDSKGTKH